MKGGVLPFCVVVALACDLRGSHAGEPPPREHVIQRDVLLPEETVVGRAAIAGRFLLLTSGGRLVEITADGRAVQRLLAASDVELWGLAAASDGTLWALAGRDALVELSSPERPPRRITLDGAYAGLHTGPGFLLYQPYDFRVGSPALLRGAVAAVGNPAGSLRVAGGSGRRVALWMKSLAQCGFVSHDRVPCWPAGAAAVDVIDATGAGRLVALGDLAPRSELSGEAFAEKGRPVLQDVALHPGDELWVLAAPPDAPVTRERGVRDLWRFSLSGARLQRHRLAVLARMLILVPSGPLVLSGDGHLVRVEVR